VEARFDFLPFYDGICDPLSENPALPANIRVRGDFIRTGRFPAKLRLLCHGGGCTVSSWIMKPGCATIKML